jgi:hypothetical protein
MPALQEILGYFLNWKSLTYKYCPLTPLKKGESGIKVSVFKGDLEGSKTFDTYKITLWLTPRKLSNILS